MKIIVTTEPPVDEQLTAKITVPAAEVNAAVKKAYKDMSQKYSFQGFRRGHVPRAVVDGIIGRQAVLASATNDILNDIEPLVLEELDVAPLGRLSFGDEQLPLVVEGEDYVVDGFLKLRPAPELKSYDAPQIKMPPETATEAEIDYQLGQYVKMRPSYEDIEDQQRACVEGDVVSLAIENIENAEYFVGKDRIVELNGRGVPEGLQAGIIGMVPGETKQIEWTVDHDFDGEPTEVKHVVKATLNSIKRAGEAQIDVEFAQLMGFDDVDALRVAIGEEITLDKRQRLPQLKEDRVVEAVADRLWLDEVSPEYVEQVYNELVNDFLGRLQSQGTTLDAFLRSRYITMDQFIADARQQAGERARQSLALDAFARHLGITVTEDELKEEFEKAGRPVSTIELFRQDGQLPGIRDAIKRNKALNWLVENAEVTVVDEVAEIAAAERAASEAFQAARDEARAAADAAEDAESVETEAAEVVEAAAETTAEIAEALEEKAAEAAAEAVEAAAEAAEAVAETTDALEAEVEAMMAQVVEAASQE